MISKNFQTLGHSDLLYKFCYSLHFLINHFANFTDTQNKSYCQELRTILLKIDHCNLFFTFCYFLHFLTNLFTHSSDILNIGSYKRIQTPRKIGHFDLFYKFCSFLSNHLPIYLTFTI